MRVLVDVSGYALNNVGDVAMLQVAVSRLQALWPGADISVLASAPGLLQRYCPGTRPLASNGLRKWLDLSYPPGRWRAPKTLSRHLATTESWFREHLGDVADGLALRRARGTPADIADLEAFLEAADASDLLVLSGGGYLTDSFRGHAFSSLELLGRFQKRGAKTAMVGQGIGPLKDAVLLAFARRTLPKVDLIAVRESRAALPLLDAVGVPSRRIRVTGDDAIEPAFESRPERLGTALGVNVRVSSYSGVGREQLGEIRTALQKAAREVAAAVLEVPISRAAADSDVDSLRELLVDAEPRNDPPDGLDTPLAVIRRVGCCRVVVTGSYHAGVFALSQGIPVVGLTQSAYYTDKFQGLAGQFGSGCRLLTLDQPDFVQTLSTGVRELWDQADALRPKLLGAAARQVEEGRAAYAQLGLLAGAPASVSVQVSSKEMS